MFNLISNHTRPSKVFLAVFSACALAPTDIVAQVSTTYKEQQESRLIRKQFDTPDTTGLWYHIRQGQKTLANTEFARLKSEFPNWKVTSDIETALKELNTKRSSTSNRKQPEQKVNARALPLQLFADKTKAQQSLVTFDKFKQLSHLANQENQYGYHMLLGWTAINKGWLDEALNHFNSADSVSASVVQQKQVIEGRYALANGFTIRALNNNDMDKLRALLKGEWGKQVGSTLQGEAWKQYEAERYALAQSLFELLNDHEGVWLSLRAQGKNNLAGNYACEDAGSQRFLTRCADFLASEQARFYDEGAFQKSVDSGLLLRKIRRLHVDENTLLGWGALKASHAKSDVNAEIAKEAFTATLVSQPENEDVALALVQLSNEARRRALAERFPIVKRILNRQIANTAWPRKQFILAYNSGDPRAINAQTKDAYSVVAGLSTRSRSGDYGMGNFDVLTNYIGLGGMNDSWRWQVSLDYQQLYSGKPVADRWFAEDSVTSQFSGISGFEDKGLRAELEYQESAFNFYANIEYQLFDQPVDAEVTGQLSATWFLPEVTLATSVFHLPKTDSLLSQTGTFNSEHTNGWGYVIADGISLLAAHSFKPNWSIAGTFEWATLEGDLVAKNDYLSLRTDISYDIGSSVSSYFDYWRIGPFLSYLGYENNLSGFTYGHGGYFSPNYLVTLGAYSELLTVEAHRWQLKLSTTLGISKVKESSAPRFPLLSNRREVDDSDEPNMIPESRSSGLSGNVAIEGQYRLSDHWVIAGYVGKAFAVEYQAFKAGIQVRWRPGKGRGVTSDELLRSSPRVSGFAL